MTEAQYLDAKRVLCQAEAEAAAKAKYSHALREDALKLFRELTGSHASCRQLPEVMKYLNRIRRFVEHYEQER